MKLYLLLFQGEGGSLFSMLWLFLIIGGIFYFLVIRPQRKQRDDLQKIIANLKNGDEVVTSGGVIGKILETKDASFVIRSADKSNLEIGKSAIIGTWKEPEKS